MKQTIVSLVSLTVLCISSQVMAGHDHASVEDCIDTVLNIKDGVVTRAEYHNYSHEGSPAYEIEIIDNNDREWEFECSTLGHIVEIEQEVKSASDPLFKNRAKVSEADAEKTAISIYNGEVEKVEYEIEFDGSPSYEFNIETEDGTEFNVEVSAVSGEIIEVSTEGWAILIED